MSGTPGFLNTYAHKSEGTMALAISLEQSSGIELRVGAAIVNLSSRLTRIKFYVGIAAY